MKNCLEIKPLKKADRDAWSALWTRYLEFYETTVSTAIYETTFQRLLSSEPYDPNGFIAWQNGEAVGLVHYLYHRHCWREENVCYLQDLFVGADIRGSGVGRALIKRVYLEADEAGYPTVYWTTAEDNTVARQLYDRIAKKTPFIKYQR
ncbi:N-acetyltransferase family protein [Parasphingorhabdus sp. DH2-15]|uniref:GNAT family N-acetyltransferase n=1 Tax=Parasphingorhabdus sp. DH2-15 TaxID=3444112 RepID=UPI003F68366B